MFKLKICATLVAMLALVGTGQAALVNLGDGTVKDTATNLIWLQNWATVGDANWATQNAWADNLTFAGSDAWALPTIGQYTTLFAEVGNLTLVTQFTGVQEQYYWSSTMFRPDRVPRDVLAFYPIFDFPNGFSETNRLSAVAVRFAVPEPDSLALVLLALGAGALAWRRRPG